MKKVFSYWTAPVIVALGIYIELQLFDSICQIERNELWISRLYNLIPSVLAGGLCMLGRSRKGAASIAAVLFSLNAIWLICNYMYFRANGLYVTWQVAHLAGNLHGYSSAILACWTRELSDFILLGITCTTAVALLPYAHSGKRTGVVFILALAGYLTSVPVKYQNRRNLDSTFSKQWFSLTEIPDTEGEACSMEYSERIYMNMHSSITYLLTFCRDAVIPKPGVRITEEDEVRLRTFVGDNRPAAEPEGHLLYILVESMEGWIMETNDIHGNPICPNILHWAESRPSVRCDAVFSQKIYGESGDGQLICTTGLLPIDEGLTCNIYGDNVYPNFAHFYPKSAIISPSNYMFNREITTYSYGFKELIEPKKETPWWDDAAVVDSTIAYLTRAAEPSCVMSLTIDSHMPFNKHMAEVDLPDTLDEMVSRYIRSFRHVDNELGRLLQWADTAACMQGATIVLTGDHYVYYDSFCSNKWCCPLILCSPSITEKIRPAEMYQMDIWTTLLDALGQTDYYWQGLGVSALRTDMSCPVREQERPCSPEEAYYLSNLFIRTDYFRNRGY